MEENSRKRHRINVMVDDKNVGEEKCPSINDLELNAYV